MPWHDTISLRFRGSFIANFVPHLVAGVSRQMFRTPFARKRGQMQSSPTLKVLWAVFHVAAACGLRVRLAHVDIANLHHIVVARLGDFATAWMPSRVFARDPAAL